MQVVARMALVALLVAAAVLAPRLRHQVLHAMTSDDAEPAPSVRFPDSLPERGLPPADRVRVVLVDGLAATTAAALPAWQALCAAGTSLEVDVGFPTVSLPVEVALWTGLTQQQTGIMARTDRPLVPPLADSIPAKVPGSRAIAENHGWIVRSLGFADAQPLADPSDRAGDANPLAWRTVWLAQARDAVASAVRLAFVHILRVDTIGHLAGRGSPQYALTAGIADQMVAMLVAAAPDARWFLLSDHGHLDEGGHGGEERELRRVAACIIGGGIGRQRGGPVHIVDIARAIADSVGVALDARSPARPLRAALASPLDGDQAVPALPLRNAAFGLLLVVLAAVASYAAAERWWLWPWWFATACVALALVRGLPTLSMPMVYAPTGRAMYVTWLPSLGLAAASTYVALGTLGLARVAIAQLAVPIATLAATITACHAWRTLLGDAIAPVVPHYTAWLSPLLLVIGHGSAAVALGVVARLVRQAFSRRAPAAPRRSESATG